MNIPSFWDPCRSRYHDPYAGGRPGVFRTGLQ